MTEPDNPTKARYQFQTSIKEDLNERVQKLIVQGYKMTEIIAYGCKHIELYKKARKP